MSDTNTIRIGAIDVGTNSVHLVVADVSPDEGISVIEKQRRQVALGEGGLGGRKLTDPAMNRTVEALREFKTACDSLDVHDIHCAATSAVREAENGVEFCRRVKAEVGIHVRIINGQDEARLIYLGARRHVDFSQGRVLLADLGGGSTEFVLCDAETAHIKLSVPIGHLRATAQHRGQDPMTRAEVDAIRIHTRRVLALMSTRIHPDDVGSLVGTSGTIRCLARMATLKRGGVPTEHDDGLVLTRKELQAFIQQFQKLPRSRISKLPGMDDRRLKTLPAGAVIVHEILCQTQQSRLVTSAYSLRDGLLWDWIQRHKPELERTRLEADPRRRSVLGVMDRYSVDPVHAEFVASTSLNLFDATAPLHRLRVDDRRLLEFAAMLHDVGHHISGEDHHKHGQYLIRNTRMSGFTAPEIDQLGLIVRYHRGKAPKKRDLARLTPEDARKVSVLAAILAVADGLDRGHDRNIQQVEGRLDGEVLTISCTATGPSHLEHWAAVQRSQSLAQALGAAVKLDFTSMSDTFQ